MKFKSSSSTGRAARMLPDITKEIIRVGESGIQIRPVGEATETATHADTFVCIGWVDDSRLTRETMSQAVASTQPLFLVVPFECVDDCIAYAERTIDLVVYHSHDTETVDLD